MQNIVIIDCGSGNIRSCAKALESCAVDIGLEARISIAVDAKDLSCADRVVMPGQGAFRTCMLSLREIPDMLETLHDFAFGKCGAFLGICVGMQVLADFGYEHEVTSGLGWLGGDVVGLSPSSSEYRIPHMGWNSLRVLRDHALLPESISGEYVYFANSYHFCPLDSGDLLLSCDYGGSITAMVARDNLAGTQFHPEKSGLVGLSLLRRFLLWNI